jgi:glucosamine--fructose-6-phosphate aminotransferase (isomerizing)
MVQAGRRHGAITLSVTNAPESPLARAAELHIDVLAGEERAVAATKSYTAQLAARYQFASRLVVTGRGYAFAAGHRVPPIST